MVPKMLEPLMLYPDPHRFQGSNYSLGDLDIAVSKSNSREDKQKTDIQIIQN